MDASAFIYRAYHAMGPLTGPGGQPTGALFGFANSLLRLLKDKQPELLAVVYDSREKGRRQALYPKYKENRPPMPPDLISQQGPIRELTTALGFYSLETPGFEADDVIATLCRRLVTADRPVVIVSGDKDFYQLLSDQVSMYDPNPKKQSALTAAAFREKYQLEPASFLDAQALMGDSSDNIPGVPRVGEVTATKLIQEYGSLDNLYANLDKVKSKSVQANLRQHKDAAYVSLELARLGVEDLPAVDFELLRPKAPDLDALNQIFTKFGLVRLKAEFQNIFNQGDLFSPNYPSPPKSITPSRPKPSSPGPSSPGPSSPSLFEALSIEAVNPAVADIDVNGDSYVLLENGDNEAFLAKLAAAKTVALSLKALTPTAAIVGLGLAFNPNEAYYLPFNHKDQSQNLDLANWLNKLGPLLTDPQKDLIALDAKFSWRVLAREGLNLPPPKDDPVLAAYLLNPDERRDLDYLSASLLGHRPQALADLFDAKKGDFEALSANQATRYAAEEADLALRLTQALRTKLAAKSQLLALYEKVELPLTELLARMELTGVLIDPKAIATIGQDLGRDLLIQEKEIYEQANDGVPFNIGSPKQLSEILFVKLKLKTGKKTAKKTAFSTDNEVLRELLGTHQVIESIINWRELAKLKNTYADKLPLLADPSGRIHTTYNQALTATGRLSSSNPNLQNIPARSVVGRKIRSFFVAPPGWVLIGADYSQIELRIMAHFSQDAALLKAFENDEDIHAETAAKIFGLNPSEISPTQRRMAKTINFGVIYGQGAYGLSKRLNITNAEAKKIIDDYFARFPGVLAYMDQIKRTARDQGEVETWFGRIRRLNGISSAIPTLRGEAERMAINTPIQGTAADLIKMATILADAELKRRGLSARLILQVHDELVAEAPTEESEAVGLILAEAMRSAGQNPLVAPPLGRGPLTVNLKAEVAIGPNWARA
jgi:DNA polymerase-1